jgi:hypothetical protein
MFMVGMAGSPRVLLFQNSPIWQELAKYAIFLHLTPLQQRYNECRWDGAGRERICNRRDSRASHNERAATTPLVVFPGFGIFFAATRETH